LKTNMRFLILGFAVGFVSLVIVLVVAIAAQGRTLFFDHSWGKVVKHLVNAGSAAIVVGPVEELLFRGGLFGVIRKQHGWKTALAVSSLIYSAVHFMDRATWPGPVTWSSGLFIVWKMLTGTADLSVVVPKFVTLTTAGVVLGLAYYWMGHLWFSIGLHAGWIFWVKSYGFVTRPVEGSAIWIWGSNRLVDGWLAAGVMLAILALLLANRWYHLRLDAQNAARRV
ncbi:MAG: CPBP family intramembrane metalloprotease, partial [Verrucomicrobiae bacterium]|nr:CPBP family intramembrane metalloprotease [Verrucomicrobiae bacterium]